MNLPGPLVALTPGNLGADERAGAIPVQLTALLRAVQAARAGGLRAVLLREPSLGDRLTLELARGLREVLGPEAWLGVHDRAHLCAAAAADAVHLSFRSLSPRLAREVVGAGTAIGLSTHADDDSASWAGADYLFHGPVFETPKAAQAAREPIGSTGLAACVARSSVPVLGLGGVRPEHVPALLQAGAAGVAVLRGVLGGERGHDPRAAARAYVEAAAEAGA